MPCANPRTSPFAVGSRNVNYLQAYGGRRMVVIRLCCGLEVKVEGVGCPREYLERLAGLRPAEDGDTSLFRSAGVYRFRRGYAPLRKFLVDEECEYRLSTHPEGGRNGAPIRPASGCARQRIQAATTSGFFRPRVWAQNENDIFPSGEARAIPERWLNSCDVPSGTQQRRSYHGASRGFSLEMNRPRQQQSTSSQPAEITARGSMPFTAPTPSPQAGDPAQRPMGLAGAMDGGGHRGHQLERARNFTPRRGPGSLRTMEPTFLAQDFKEFSRDLGAGHALRTCPLSHSRKDRTLRTIANGRRASGGNASCLWTMPASGEG